MVKGKDNGFGDVAGMGVLGGVLVRENRAADLMYNI